MSERPISEDARKLRELEEEHEAACRRVDRDEAEVLRLELAIAELHDAVLVGSERQG
jgi:hypothetical protein